MYRSIFHRITDPIKAHPIKNIGFCIVSLVGQVIFDNIIGIFRQVSILGLFSTAMMFVMLAGYIDLSLGSIASFSSVFFAMCISESYWHLPVPLAVLMTFGICAIIGLLNGTLITWTGMEPLVGTLATSTVLSGITFLMCMAKPISKLPKSILFIGQGFIGQIPVPVIVLAIILVVVWFLLNRTYIGRYLYAVGSNSEAAMLSGIRSNVIKRAAYITAAMLAGFAGIVLTSRLNSGQPMAGDSYQMNSLVACSVGGISMAGGSGSVYNLVCGIFVLGVITNGMLIYGLNSYVQNIVQGLALATAVSIDYLQRKKPSAV